MLLKVEVTLWGGGNATKQSSMNIPPEFNLVLQGKKNKIYLINFKGYLKSNDPSPKN